MKKKARTLLKRHHKASKVRIERVAPRVGPASPVWAVTAERLVVVWSGPVRLVVRAVARSVARLPEAWEKAFRSAREELLARS